LVSQYFGCCEERPNKCPTGLSAQGSGGNQMHGIVKPVQKPDVLEIDVDRYTVRLLFLERLEQRNLLLAELQRLRAWAHFANS
jgi:hypothetical protein